MKIKMKKVDENKLLEYGFKKQRDTADWINTENWYEKVIPNSFRGTYTLCICSDAIYGVYQGIYDYELELDKFIDRLGFRSPDAAEGVKKLLADMKQNNTIDYDEVE
jgi:hypothetical protein